MKLSGAEIIIKFLERFGIKYVAGIPGGSNLPVYDALSRSPSIRHILARHEQGAGFIAHGIARSTGKPGVCFATSGPGVTNLLTAIADAYLDSVPLIAITGQVPLHLIGTDAFQEVDTYGLTIPVTKHNFLIKDVHELFYAIPEAFRIALSGRPGPVVIDVPKNIQTAICEFDKWPEFEIKNKFFIDETQIQAAADLIHKSRKPLLYIGGGIISSGASARLMELAEKNSIPVTSSLMGLGSFPAGNPLYTGMLGMHGARYTNMITREADLIIAMGVRFDDRATGRVEDFCPDIPVIHIDIDQAEINKIKKSTYSINGDLNMILKYLIPLTRNNKRNEWLSFISKQKHDHPFIYEEDPLHPVNILKYISKISAPDTIITTDVGQHQMWVAQSYPFNQPRTFLTSGGLGTMGFGLPAAIGASLANPEKTVICISGDGSILMNIQELATLADLDLPVKIIIMNNKHLGLVRQQQEMFYNSNIFATGFKTNPDFAAIADKFSIPGFSPEPENACSVLREALQSRGPALINLDINHEYNVLPIVPAGSGNHEMVGGKTHEKYNT